MAKYLAHSCRCNGYLAIVLPERERKMPVQAINGRCARCGHRLAWILIRGSRVGVRHPRFASNKTFPPLTLRCPSQTSGTHRETRLAIPLVCDWLFPFAVFSLSTA